MIGEGAARSGLEAACGVDGDPPTTRRVLGWWGLFPPGDRPGVAWLAGPGGESPLGLHPSSEGHDVQGELFATQGEPPGGGLGVGRAVSGPVAGSPAFPSGVRVGTSSWSFPGWEGLVYDGVYSPGVLAVEGLAAYSSHGLFRTVGLDRGYYRPVPRETLAGMADQVPPDFRFVLKAPVQVTGPVLRGGARGSNPDFLDPRVAGTLAVAPFMEGLGDRGGVLLFQFPPMGIRSPQRGEAFLERLGSFLRKLPQGGTYAVELRDPVLWGEGFRRVLAEAGAVPGFAVHPAAPPLARQFRIIPPEELPVTMVRWLLPPDSDYEEAREAFAPFRSLQEPDPAHRALLAELAGAGAQAGRPTFIIVNNKAEGSAPLSVVALSHAMTNGGRGGTAGGDPR